MNAESPMDGLRLLASLISADLRAGSPVLQRPEPVEEEAPHRGRPKLVPFAVVAEPQSSDLEALPLAA
jgi:hypothetical protein